MKRVIKIFLLIILLLLVGCGKQVTEEEARQALHNNLIERYGEEFEIGYMQFRSSEDEMWYQAKIYPTKYKGNSRGKDEYYKSNGNVNIEKNIFGEKIGYVGDLYRVVLFNESANEFYLPKLKELFGENVLPVLEIDSSRVSKNPEFLSNPKFLPEYKKRLDDGSLPFLKGGIYIFGRVESDEDREWYRKQIYEFVQFMKQTGTFEYVRLSIYIIDERMLVNGAEKCFENIKYTSKTRKGITKEIDKALNPMTEEYNKLTTQEKLIKLSSYNKGNILNEIRGILLLVPIASAKYIDSNSFSDDEITELFGRKKEYNNINDIQFKYEDYAIKEVKNE